MPITDDQIKAQKVLVLQKQLAQIQAQKDFAEALAESQRLQVQKQLDDLTPAEA